MNFEEAVTVQQVCALFMEVDFMANKDKNKIKNDHTGEMLPVWLKYPEIPLGSIGWRMGYGEAYSSEFYDWYGKLTKEEQAAYDQKYPEPVCWSNSEWNIKRHDTFWIYNWQGMSADEAKNCDITKWRGSNLLGFALMTVRDELARIWNR